MSGEGPGGGSSPESAHNSMPDSVFKMTGDPQAVAEADAGLGNRHETQIVFRGSSPDSGTFGRLKGDPEVKNNTSGGTRPDGGGGLGGDPDIIDGEVREDDFEGEKNKEKKENKYTWREFSEKVRPIISFERIDETIRNVVDELESVGIRISAVFEEEIDTHDMWERKRIARELLGQILDDIQNKIDLHEDKKRFFIEGLGVSEERLKQWESEVRGGDGATSGTRSGAEETAGTGDGGEGSNTETAETRRAREKADRETRAHEALTRLIATGGVDAIDEPLFQNWIAVHGTDATMEDYQTARNWLSGIETRRQERKAAEARRQDDAERLKQEKEDRENIAKAAEKDEERRLRDEKKRDDDIKIREINNLNREISDLGSRSGTYTDSVKWLEGARDIVRRYTRPDQYPEITNRISSLQNDISSIVREMPELEFKDRLNKFYDRMKLFDKEGAEKLVIEDKLDLIDEFDKFKKDYGLIDDYADRVFKLDEKMKIFKPNFFTYAFEGPKAWYLGFKKLFKRK